jgi:hypothetical protein
LCLAALQPAAIVGTRPIIVYDAPYGSEVLPPVVNPQYGGGAIAPHLASGAEYSGGAGGAFTAQGALLKRLGLTR